MIRQIIILIFSVVCVMFARQGVADQEIVSESLQTKSATEAEFQKLYKAWKESPPSFSSNPNDLLKNPEYRAIIDAGPKMLPFIVDKMEQGDSALFIAFEEVTKYRLDLKNPKFWSFRNRTKACMQFWEEGSTAVKLKVAKFQEEHKTCEVKKDDLKKAEIIKKTRDLGIAVLPHLVEDFKKGDLDFVPVFIELTDGKVRTENLSPEEAAKKCIEWWEANSSEWTIPFEEKTSKESKNQRIIRIRH